MEPPITEGLSSLVELYIKCLNLKNMDHFSKSDPCVVVQMDEQPPRKQWKDIGRTEVIKNNLNPTFKKTFSIVYKFEQVQSLRFMVYDVDNATASLEDDDFIGCMTCSLAEICGSRGMQLVKPLANHKGKVNGRIVVTADEMNKSSTTDGNRDDLIELGFRGTHLAKKDLFGKSDPYFVVSKMVNQDYLNVYESEVVKHNLNPMWKPFKLTRSKLCNVNNSLPLRFSCYDWDRYSSHDFIGSFDTTLGNIIANSADNPNFSFQLIDNKKGKNKQTGNIHITTCSIQKQYNFLEYIQGGCQLSLMVAVDFTASNQNPKIPGSLHYCDPSGMNMNEYEKAIRSVGDILAYYDHDKKFPAFGFGAKMPDGQVSHCFSLGGNPFDPECVGIDGILSAYKQAIYNVELWGPTNFAPVIRTATKYASQHMSQENQQYFVLLIITDGAISDIDDTIKAVIEASERPLSIVIVGVGGADFSNMEVLDSDTQLLTNGYATAKRDIVQFVPFRRFANQHYSALAAETLAEIPHQLQEYMRMRNMIPNPRVQVNISPAEVVPSTVNITYNPNV